MSTKIMSEDLASSDEIKEYNEEGEEDRGEDLLELKSKLIVESSAKYIHHPMQLNKVCVSGPHSASHLSFMMSGIEPFRQPPPAHMGIPVGLDLKTGIPRSVPWHPGQYSHGVFPDFAQQLQWHSPSMYPINHGAFRSAYPSSLSTNPSFSSFSPQSLIGAHHGIPGHPGLSTHHLLAASSGPKYQQDLSAAVAAINFNQSQSDPINSRRSCLSSFTHHAGSNCNINQKPSLNRLNPDNNCLSSGISSPNGGLSANLSISSPNSPENKHKSNDNNNHINAINSNNNNSNTFNKNHVKKPLNAFMLFMKENRAAVVAKCTLKESAAINQILGRKWHELEKDQQAIYYEKAKAERQLHMQRYPGWSAKDNYAVNQRKKKKKRDKSGDGEGGSLKKCRARFGLEQQTKWCKPCRRKKKCTRFLDTFEINNESDGDIMNSVESYGAPTPDSKSANDSESDNMNLSSTELSLSSPPVPNTSDYLLPRHSSNHRLGSNDFTSITQPSSSPSSLASFSCPPRNSPIGPNNPLSIEQLTRPHCPSHHRTSLPSSCVSNNIIKSNCIVPTPSTSLSSQSNDALSLPQLPTPPSTDSSTSGAPQMLTVA